MQRVVRSTLVGLLTIAGLAACGDKITVPGTTTTPPDLSVQLVTVSPNSVTLPVGSTVTLAASVSAGPQQTVRTVTWSSADATIATVDATGKVTGVKAGVTSITAAATADPTVKGAAVVTVSGSGGTTPPQVLISAITQGGTQFPANLAGAAGQLDVVLDVQTNGQTLRTVSATMTCPGPTTMTQTQSVAGASATDAEGAEIPVILSFPTNAFTINASNVGVPTLRNGACSITASATTGATGSAPQTATTTTQLTLANVDGVVLSNSFAAITNILGQTQLTQANDQFGLPWRSGSVTVAAIPVLYSGRTLASVTITLPGATGAEQTLTTAPFSASYSGSASSGSRVTGLTLVDQSGVVPAGQPGLPGVACGAAVSPGCGAFEVNGQTPRGVTAFVIALDANGNDIPLVTLPGGTATTFRLDNTPPMAPLAFNTPGRQSPGWVNASYVFATTGRGSSSANLGAAISGAASSGTDGSSAGTQNYISCGDGNQNVVGSATFPAFTNDQRAAAGPYVCQQQLGVSSSGGTSVGVGNGATNGQTTFAYYAIPAASFVAASTTNGTSTSGSACSISGSWVAITTADGLAAVTASNAYVVRVFELDKFLNARCTDLAKPPANAAALGTMINTGVAGTYTANAATFGVDKAAPTANFVDAGNAACPAPGGCANANGSSGIGAPGVPAFLIAVSDDASGTSSLPSVSKLTRLAIDPATSAQSLTSLTANGTTLFGCPVGWNAGGPACGTAQTIGTISVDNGSGTDGYYTLTSRITDVARNSAPTLTRSFVIDRAAPVMGSIAVPSSITGGTSVSLATSATDNLDLISYDYTLSYNATLSGGAAPLLIRSPNVRPDGTPNPAQTLNTAFSGTLKPSTPFSLVVPFFIRNVATTSAANAPQNNGVAPQSVASRSYDAANNASAVNVGTGSGFSNIAAAAINTTPAVINFAAAQPNTAVMASFAESNAIANISNCPTVANGGCGGTNAAAANATVVTLTASSSGSEGPTFQFINPFSQVQFYFFDPTIVGGGEWVLIGAASNPVVTDNQTQTVRTFTWTLGATFDPPAAIGVGALRLIAVGVNSAGDALASAVNTNVTLTNP